LIIDHSDRFKKQESEVQNFMQKKQPPRIEEPDDEED